jgi:hypothetical protein
MPPFTLFEYGLAAAGGVLVIGFAALILWILFCLFMGNRPNP